MFQYTDISLQEIPGEISLVIYNPTCNLRCPWCFNPNLLDKKPLSYKQMKDAIDAHLDFITGVCFSGGEPLCNPFFQKITKYASDCGLKIKLNTNGLVPDQYRQNCFIPYFDYINISLKGFYDDYCLHTDSLWSIIPHTRVLEYSFVYSPSIWPQLRIQRFHEMLQDKIVSDWRAIFSNSWSKPDIFTVVQMDNQSCLSPIYNDCRVPNKEECAYIAKIFTDIPYKKLMIETKEFGREVIQ